MVARLGSAGWTLFELEAAGPRREGYTLVEEIVDPLVVVAILRALGRGSFNLPARALWIGYRDVTVIESEREDVVAEFGGKTEEWRRDGVALGTGEDC